ncbi:hypothetical protein [Chryseobacterium sp.]|uniref:hypothetical protein n=1 Tax=Chryseobacterium sp. TaxID=1871047 RepID=UPI0012A95B5A|nr:hypothetical protein [Chryseobacterium sp.]QFG53439.1 hypothetical protein F7R58_07710 [Chryseobacterium sp.]
MKNILLGILAFASVILVSCNNPQTDNTHTAVTAFTIGDIVPNDQVCMVNNAYMGKRQLEVQHEGKTYYGCCENCQVRIPQEESARMAYDPVSNKMIDKATAVIAISDKNDNVVYFEDKANYEVFFKKKFTLISN